MATISRRRAVFKIALAVYAVIVTLAFVACLFFVVGARCGPAPYPDGLLRDKALEWVSAPQVDSKSLPYYVPDWPPEKKVLLKLDMSLEWTKVQPGPEGQTRQYAWNELPEGMLLVKGGQSVTGDRIYTTQGSYQGRKVHGLISLRPFAIDRDEVTIGDYCSFLKAVQAKGKNVPMPDAWRGSFPPRDKWNLPVTGVGYGDAVHYAEWKGKRLPTFLEWEKAARGNRDDRIFVWGTEVRPDWANIHSDGPTPAGTYPKDVSQWGCRDMNGNVMEWTSSRIQRTGYVNRIVMGGSWRSWPAALNFRISGYMYQHMNYNFYPPNRNLDYLGFRCVVDVADCAEARSNGKPRLLPAPALVDTGPRTSWAEVAKAPVMEPIRDWRRLYGSPEELLLLSSDPPVSVPKGFVYVPPGEFWLGHRRGPSTMRPFQRVFLPGYFIGRCEVTNRQYNRFVQSARVRPPRCWPYGRLHPLIADYPVTEVSFADATAYATYAGAHLPTEFEWEKAARGVDGRSFPWGNNFDRDRANVMESGYGGPIPVSQLNNASPYGALDMCGNVFEWTTSWHDIYPGAGHVDFFRFGRRTMIVRDAGYDIPFVRATTYHRYHAWMDYSTVYRGLRLAMSLPAEITGKQIELYKSIKSRSAVIVGAEYEREHLIRRGLENRPPVARRDEVERKKKK